MKEKHDLWGKVYRAKDLTQLHAYLLEAEARIKDIVGDNPLAFYLRSRSEEVLGKINDLLGTRRYILDKLFTYTDDEIKRMEAVNSLLRRLYEQMYRRTANLYRTILKGGTDSTFDDDYEVEGTLDIGVEYDKDEGDYDTVLHLENDIFYDSDFPYMLYTIRENDEEYNHSLTHVCECNLRHFPGNTPEMTDEELGCDYTFLEDGVTWNECLNREDLSHICFSYAFHTLFTDHPYSLADIIRINSFVVEAKLVCQRITDQKGRRHVNGGLVK